jgi:hypothetical protein
MVMQKRVRLKWRTECHTMFMKIGRLTGVEYTRQSVLIGTMAKECTFQILVEMENGMARTST